MSLESSTARITGRAFSLAVAHCGEVYPACARLPRACALVRCAMNRVAVPAAFDEGSRAAT